MQQWKRIAAAGTAAVAMTAAAGAPAQASDATLKAAIEDVVPKVAPTVQAFVTEAEKASTSGSVTKLKQATGDVRTAISRYKWTVINYKADTDAGLAGKRALLVAIRQYDIGFAAYATALDKATSGASRASLTKSLRTFAKRVDEAVEDEAAALEALGITA